MTFLQRSRRASEAASCGGGSTGCVGDVGVVHAGILRHDDESSATPRITNDSPLGSLLKIRGGASSSSHRGNNAVQGVLKSILASPSLPSPIKQLIEMICGFIENLTDWKVLPRVEDDRKSKSKKTKPRRERVPVDEANVGVATRTTRIPKKRGERKAEDESEEVEMAVLAKKKRRKMSPKVESASGEPAETIVEKVAPAVFAGGATTALKPNPPTPSRATADAASKKFLSNSLKSSNPNYRIQRELKEFLSPPPPGLSVKISGKNVRLWIVTLDMPSNTIYAGETYRLRIKFPPDYPTSPPSVYFLPPTPRHEHVYTNGDICLSLLGTDWRPIMTAQSVAQAIMSILCGAQRKSLPMDNARHAGNKPGKKQNDWVYHDDNC